jgi:hypothetical protein
MTDNEWKLFEANLIKKYKIDPNAELAEVLIKEYSAHKLRKTDCTKELQLHIDNILAKLSKDKVDLPDTFGLNGKWGRSKIEIKYIFMNAQTWHFLFKNMPLSTAYVNTAKILSISIDDVKIGFERKNHDFGTRELSRFALDIYITMNMRELSSEEVEIANEHLNEDISTQMLKDLNHHRMKYKITY